MQSLEKRFPFIPIYLLWVNSMNHLDHCAFEQKIKNKLVPRYFLYIFSPLYSGGFFLYFSHYLFIIEFGVIHEIIFFSNVL